MKIIDENIEDNDFKVPRNNEKKKARKADLKKKAKSKGDGTTAPYIPGLPGSQVQPDQFDEEDDRTSQERREETPVEERPAASNKKRVIAEQPAEPPVDVQIKPAPWANCMSPENKELSLHDIQKIEAEKVKFYYLLFCCIVDSSVRIIDDYDTIISDGVMFFFLYNT